MYEDYPEEQMLKKQVWAVVGATTDPEKYGWMIYQKLKRHGYTVYAVNPRYQKIGEDPCYASLSALPQKPEVVDMVVSPVHGAAVIEAGASAGISEYWMQPGSCDEKLRELMKQLGVTWVEACVLVALR